MTNPFREVLGDAPEENASWREARRVLDEAAQAITERVRPAAECRVVAGYVVNLGREFKLVLHTDAVDQTLFRAYVPVDGWPVSVDMNLGDPVTCGNRVELVNALSSFLGDPSTKRFIDAYARG